MTDAPGAARVALFDLDRTLIDCNSGRLWIRSELADGRIGLRSAVWAGYWLVRYSVGRARGLDGVFATAVQTLEGQREAELRERTERWFASKVRHRLRPGGANAIDRHRTAGDRLVLATSSSVYAGTCAVEAYGLDDLVCTTFEVRDGRFTGRIASLALGDHKAVRVAEWAAARGIHLDQAVFYTDSYTDIALLEAVGEPVCVNPDRALRREAAARGWRVEDWGRAA